jgi:hypothetical protein
MRRDQAIANAQEYVDVETAKQTGRAAFGEMVRRRCRFTTGEGRVNGRPRFRLPRRFSQEKFGWPQRGPGTECGARH